MTQYLKLPAWSPKVYPDWANTREMKAGLHSRSPPGWDPCHIPLEHVSRACQNCSLWDRAWRMPNSLVFAVELFKPLPYIEQTTHTYTCTYECSTPQICTHILLCSYFKYFIYFLLERGWREKERERDISVWEIHQSVASHTPPPGDLACNPGMCLDWEWNWWSFGSQAGTQSTEPYHPGLYCVLKNKKIVCLLFGANHKMRLRVLFSAFESYTHQTYASSKLWISKRIFHKNNTHLPTHT